MTGERVLVTGASGFIGWHIARDLAAAGYDVSGTSRSADRALPANVRRAVVSDLRSDFELHNALGCVGTVIHAAGLAHVTGRLDARGVLHQTNVEGTRSLMEQAGRAGVRRVVMISSAAVHGAARNGVLKEDAPEQPCTAYGVSKLGSERVAREIAAHYDMSCIVLRPPMVYGPGMKGRPLQLFRCLARGVPLPVGALHAPRSVIFVGNLVKGVEALVASRISGTAAFLIADREAISIAAFAKAAAEALGTAARLLPVHPNVLRLLFAMRTRVRDPDGKRGRTTMGHLLEALVLDTSRITAMTGFAPSTSTADGLRRTAQWFRATHRTAG
jgi:nucleoside-diphosphate-sugar epimerase